VAQLVALQAIVRPPSISWLELGLGFGTGLPITVETSVISTLLYVRMGRITFIIQHKLKSLKDVNVKLTVSGHNPPRT